MQVSFFIDDRTYETLKRGADHFGLDLTHMLRHGADLAAIKCLAEMLRESLCTAHAWQVDPITKAVTKVESHPAAKPEDWGHAMRNATNPTPST